jgi:hypothetical protein
MPPLTVSLPQTHDTTATLVEHERYRLRYAYVRAPDTRTADETGQDYLEVREDGRRIAFALCDGVSQSFFGDVAARILGSALCDWLWSPAGLGEWLDARLCDLTRPAAERVDAVSLPAGLSPLVTSVLEDKRTLGSESMFVAGAVDFDRDALTLSWMGDSRLRVWDASGRELTKRLGNAQLDGTERWSTSRGPVGRPHVICAALANVGRVAAYSDGLAHLDAAALDFESLHQLDSAASRGALASGDDASLLIVDVLPHGV